MCAAHNPFSRSYPQAQPPSPTPVSTADATNKLRQFLIARGMEESDEGGSTPTSLGSGSDTPPPGVHYTRDNDAFRPSDEEQRNSLSPSPLLQPEEHVEYTALQRSEAAGELMMSACT